MKELWRLDAAALHAGYRAGEFDASSVFASCMARMRECEPRVNAFVHIDEAGARDSAAQSSRRWNQGRPIGPLDGVPVSFKDNLHVRGMPTRWGSACLPPTPAGSDETAVRRLREAGAVFLGKTNLPEFALQGITENLLAGATRNPWDTALTPGGSSGGAAAAVAYGAGPVALATDGGGSTRRPASHCGVVGFKASARAVSREGGLPSVFGDHEAAGIVARSVGDVQAVMQVIGSRPDAGRKAGSASRILFVPRFAGHPVDPRIDTATRDVAQRMERLGHAVAEGEPVLWAEEINELWPAYSAHGLARWFDASRCDEQLCGDAARATLQLGREAKGVEARTAAAIETLERILRGLFASYDAILTPATASLPWPVGETHPRRIAGREAGPRGHAVFTAFANAAGLPAIAVPSGFADGLPMGFQLVAPRGEDDNLLALALAWEAANPPSSHWPLTT